MGAHHEYGTNEQHMIPESVVINEFLRAIGKSISECIPPKYGFMLMIFEYGDPSKPEAEGHQGSLYYISSAQRDTMLKAMAEFIERNSSGAVS